ncbi:translation initiation factor IF-2-like [Panicum miliaceum]|uniref:Translation initiation factor IF-2-like n=1 Tax=Panicum miliaceum TaxID=4540 RepID=A0A3L6S537_PANMI|nr:translation initiation factor IF-2-like [Panicum miliaceum]
MPPPQFPSDRARPRPGDSSVPAVKRAPPASLSAAASAKIALRASAPELSALSAARPRPPPSAAAAKLVASPPDRKPVRPMPPPPPQHPARHARAIRPAPAGAARRRPREAGVVHGAARRLAPGTAVYVRTEFKPRNINCRILLWLPARVVSASDAYHLTVKYAADLNDMFAGKIVSKPVDHIRVAPHRTAARADQRKPETRRHALS